MQVAKGGELVDLDFKIRFDYPFLSPEIGLFARINSDWEESLEDLAVQLPLQSEKNDPFSTTLIREIKLEKFKTSN